MQRLVNAARDLTAPKGPPPPMGEKPAIKTFYQGPGSIGTNTNWVEKKPSQMRESVRRNIYGAAIQAYKVNDSSSQFNTIGGKSPLKFHSLKVQSPFILDACHNIFEEAGFLLADLEPIEFSDPFPALYFARSKIERVQRKHEPKTDTFEHLKLLVNLMDEVFGDTATQVASLVAKNLMSFSYAWTLFPKGCLVYTKTQGQDRLYKLRDITLGRDESEKPCWKLLCDFIRFDGTKFGVSTHTLTIPSYKGNCLITELSAYPISYHEDQGLLRRLEKRGEKILTYQDVHYCEYAGTAVPAKGSGKRNIAGRIVIDVISYTKHNPKSGISVGPFFDEKPDEPEKAAASDLLDRYQALQMSGHQMMPDQPIPNQAPKTDGLSHLKRPSLEQQESNKTRILKDPQYLALMSPMLPGFSLTDKEWLHFTVDYISNISWDDEAFDHLVYSAEHKDLLLTFVKNHKDCGRETDDVITGKGQGLILLLSGPPGTGKTLTAEAVADRSRRPLYYLSVEELGTDPAALGGVLAKVLGLAIEWNAIVLLDEADVFLARRSTDQLTRNELVSIFLRELEYYRGILFLTTNLLDTIDNAFRSRVHIHLLYSQLSFASRLRLWQGFISRLQPITSPFAVEEDDDDAGTRRSSATEVSLRARYAGSAVARTGGAGAGHALSERDMEELASWDLNGREIKNVVKTVRTWCVCKGIEFDLKRLEVGVVVTAPFAKKVGRGERERK